MTSFRIKFSLLFLSIFSITSATATDSFSAATGSDFINNFQEGAVGSPLASFFTLIIAISLFCAYILSNKINRLLQIISEHLRIERSLFSQLDTPEIKISNDEWDSIDRHWQKALKLKSHLTFIYGLPTMFGMLGTVCGLIASNLEDAKVLAEKFSVAIVSTALGIVGYIIIRFLYLRIEHRMNELHKCISMILKKKTETWNGDESDGK